MLLTAIQIVSYVVLLILMLMLANTMAMATRERTTEYAVMRAIGFQPRHIVGMVLGEGFVIALVGAVLGVGLAPPIVRSLGAVLAQQHGRIPRQHRRSSRVTRRSRWRRRWRSA